MSRTLSRGMRRLTTMLLATALALTIAGLRAAPSQADSKPQNPSDPKTPTTVTADALPTVQIDGVVWSQAIAGNTVYAGGQFTRARPAGVAAGGAGEVTRNNLLAYDITTGDLIASFNPDLNGQVRAVAVSPDGSRVYVGGDFTTVGGVTRNRIAAFDTATGELVAGFAPTVSSTVNAIAATDSTVYVGGRFNGAGGLTRNRLAAFAASDGTLLGWKASATGGDGVDALVLSPDGSELVVGGTFTALNGSDRPGYGLGAVDTSTGALVTPFAINNVIRSGGINAGVTGLGGDGQYFYGTVFSYNVVPKTEGVFAATWDGDVHWIDNCHGDTYSVHPEGEAVYVAGHSHGCGNIGAFKEPPGSMDNWVYHRAIAFGRQVTGTVATEPDQDTYVNFGGQPSSSLLTWFPSMNAGTFTGQSQGPWSVTGNADYIVMGGEFTKVNGAAQQGLVRYAVSGRAPNVRGPNLSGADYPVTLSSSDPGKVRVCWSANVDQDNDYLTYNVYRDGSTTADGLVCTKSFRAQFWQVVNGTCTDSGLAAGTHTYQVQASDPFGNTASSPWTSVDVAVGGDANRAPVAQGATVRTRVGRPVRVNLDAADPDDDSLTYAFDRMHGAQVSGTGPTVVYTPKPGFVGSTWFRYTVSDGQKSDSARVDVTVLKTRSAIDRVAHQPRRITPRVHARFTVTVLSGGAPASGAVAIWDHSRWLGRAVLDADGTAVVRARVLPRVGRHTLRVRYGGSATALPAAVTVTVRVYRR